LLRRSLPGPDTPVKHFSRISHQLWDAVRDARSECYYVTARRQALQSLRTTLGPDAYYRGALPPHVPVWRFGRMD
jgi:hypothetical protein